MTKGANATLTADQGSLTPVFLAVASKEELKQGEFYEHSKLSSII
jgi:hypothetical protein